jgi:hypothetical protein
MVTLMAEDAWPILIAMAGMGVSITRMTQHAYVCKNVPSIDGPTWSFLNVSPHAHLTTLEIITTRHA